MKKTLLFMSLVGLVGLVGAKPAEAKTYLDPYSFEEGYSAGKCVMVDTRSEADSTHVYTLNPDNTVKLNQAYWRRWGRGARCDELQFHIDHNTPVLRLELWLDSVAYDRYANIGGTHFESQTVSTSRHEWFLVKNGVLHRIPDWLTALSWGLLINDRFSIPDVHEIKFYNLVTIGEPLSFNQGSYFKKINAIWSQGSRDYSKLPSGLQDEVRDRLSLFTDCTFGYRYGFNNTYRVLLDWTWMLRNPDCPLAD